MALRLIKHLTILAFATCLGLAMPGLAQAQSEYDGGSGPAPATTGHQDISLRVNKDGTSQTIWTTRTKVFDETVIQNLAKQIITYTDVLETAEVVEAYTEKADGRRIDVDPEKIFVRDAAPKGSADVDDEKQITIIFPDLAVGDSIVYTTRRELKKPVLEGRFSARLLGRKYFTDSLEIVHPSDLNLIVAVSGEGYVH